jgi:hypothetical protein
MNILPKYLVSFVIFFTLLSCEKKTDTIVDNVVAIPSITNAALRYSQIHIDTTTNGSVTPLPDNRYQISDTIDVKVFHPYGLSSIDEVAFNVILPRSSKIIVQGKLYLRRAISADSGIYSSAIFFIINRGDAGTVSIETYARDKWRNRSSSLLLPLFVLRTNSKPRLSGLSMPDTLVRPPSGFLLFKFVVSVSDSDGYKDIAHVFFKQLFPTESNNIPLFDDGNELLSGDVLAGDGIFTRIVRIDSSNTLGERRLLFWAQDNAGEFSDSLFGNFTIIE